MTQTTADPSNSAPRRRVAKILEIGPYPPPRSGWATRIEFVRRRIEETGHVCDALNLGRMRKVPSEDYITVRNGLDYVAKVFWYSARGYRLHMHTNGDVWPTGWALALVALFAGCLFGRRAVVTFHAGVQQIYFPRERSGWSFPILYLLFKLPKAIICNNEAVKEKIVEYHIGPAKIFPIQAFSRQYAENCDVALPEPVESFLSRHDPVIFSYLFLRRGYHIDTLIDGLQRVRNEWPNVGLVNVGGLNDSDEQYRNQTMQRLEKTGLTESVCFAGDLSHDEFVSLLRRTALFVRTPTTDGECSSVLESLMVGVPVVAAENGNRPPSVLTYPATDPEAMCQQVCEVLSNPQLHRDRIVPPVIRDTVAEEAELLIDTALGRRPSPTAESKPSVLAATAPRD